MTEPQKIRAGKAFRDFFFADDPELPAKARAKRKKIRQQLEKSQEEALRKIAAWRESDEFKRNHAQERDRWLQAGIDIDVEDYNEQLFLLMGNVSPAWLEKSSVSEDVIRNSPPHEWFRKLFNAAVQEQRRLRLAESQMAKANEEPRSRENSWTADEETEARRLIDAGTVTTATALREMLSMRQASSQALFRHIKSKSKKKHRTD